MRLLILFFLAALVNCGAISNSTPTAESIVGSWKIVGTSAKPVAVEQIFPSGQIGGQITFKPDWTFEEQVTYPKSPGKTVKVSGIYAVKDGVLTLVNQADNSQTKATVKLEKDFLIAAPLIAGEDIEYFKRAD